MADVIRTNYERNGIETIVHNDWISWLNENHIEEGIRHNKLRGITIKDHSEHRKYRCELREEPKSQCNKIIIDEKLGTKVIMYCRTTLVNKFWKRLGLKQCDVIF